VNEIVSIVIGAAIALASSLLVEWRSAQRALRQRWDSDRLTAVGEFINASNKAIGALFDEGRSRGEKRDDLAERDRESRQAMDAVRLAHARAQLMLPGQRSPFDDYRRTLDELKVLADHGFKDRDPTWKDLQRRLLSDQEELVRATSLVLRIPD
jgi:hypothetical protein